MIRFATFIRPQLFKVLTDKRPFPEHTSISVVMQIISGERPKKPSFSISRGYTEDLWKLTAECWQKDPTTRPTVSDLLHQLGEAAREWKSNFL